MLGLQRVIPILLISKRRLIKPLQFKIDRYIGDPLNAVKIFNEKEVDELIVIDVDVTLNAKEPDYEFLEQLSGECFMPLTYGGGVDRVDVAKQVLRLGYEKICIGHHAVAQPDLITQLSEVLGSQSVVVAMDVKRNIFGELRVYTKRGMSKTSYHPVDFAVLMEKKGAGELLLTDIKKEGTRSGYNLDLLTSIVSHVQIPVIIHGGAGNVEHFKEGFNHHANGVAAGSMFVFYGPHDAVLIQYINSLEGV